MARSDIVRRGELFSDKGSRYSWNWEWLEKEYSVTVSEKEGKKGKQTKIMILCYDHCIKKLAAVGKAYCDVCRKEVAYGNKGFTAIKVHCDTSSHKEKIICRSENNHLPGQPLESETCGPHAGPSQKQKENVLTLTPVSDRVHNLTALTLGFVAEHSLPVNLVPSLLDYVKAMASDRRAVQRMPSIAASTASYKLRHGLQKTLQDEILAELKTCYFSLNIDEAMSKTKKKVLAILTSHFSPSMNRIVVHHFAAISVVKVTSDNLFEEVSNFMTKHGLPWANLTSVLMDSCRVMRGSKSGLEVQIKEKAPNMLDIDGDTCHHANNAAHVFCKPFGKHVEQLLGDLHTEFHYSTELRDVFFKFCVALQIKATAAEQFASHRWLSVLDVSVDTLRLWDATVLYTASFLMEKDMPAYQPLIDEVFQRRGVNEKGRDSIRKAQIYLRKKWSTFTVAGKDRKLRLVNKIFILGEQTLILLNLYVSILSILKEYIVFFQKREPVVHRLHDKQTELLKDFLACFVKPEALSAASDVTSIDLTDPDNIHMESMFTISSAANTLMKKQPKEVKKSIRLKMREAFVKCGTYLQEKMPVNNKVLKICSVLDPIMRNTTQARQLLGQIPSRTNLVQNDQDTVDRFHREVNKYTYDVSPSSASEDAPVDVCGVEFRRTGFLSCVQQQKPCSVASMAQLWNPPSARWERSCPRKRPTWMLTHTWPCRL
ncbi:uncharacterized protein LOC112565660 [Pomacea canaliculata]|uniref:uncharacterized protein LOC112565660 n=1 Tax=Pomacea canaliculata TaxID=400727 RepID=UPI000D7306C8|nr:uncharacterized protein LOC112565660 [Pomacea canaliculata]